MRLELRRCLACTELPAPSFATHRHWGRRDALTYGMTLIPFTQARHLIGEAVLGRQIIRKRRVEGNWVPVVPVDDGRIGSVRGAASPTRRFPRPNTLARAQRSCILSGRKRPPEHVLLKPVRNVGPVRNESLPRPPLLERPLPVDARRAVPPPAKTPRTRPSTAT